MLAFLLSLLAAFVIVVTVNVFRYVKYGTRYRIFFDIIDGLGNKRTKNVCLLADSKEEAEKRLKRIFLSASFGDIVIHDTSLVKPDIKIDILDKNETG